MDVEEDIELDMFEEGRGVDLMGFLGGATFDLEFDYDLNNVGEMITTLDNIRNNIKCEECKGDAVVVDESLNNAVRCEEHQDFSDNEHLQVSNQKEKLDEKLRKFKEEVNKVKDSMLEAQIMYGTVKEERSTIDENEIAKFEELYDDLKTNMKNLKKNYKTEGEKPNPSYDKFIKLSKMNADFLNRFEKFYNIGAEHALKNPLNDMINKIIEVVEDESKIESDNDVTIENDVLIFKRNLVPILPKEHFNEVQDKLNQYQRLSEEIDQTDAEIDELKQMYSDFVQRK